MEQSAAREENADQALHDEQSAAPEDNALHDEQSAAPEDQALYDAMAEEQRRKVESVPTLAQMCDILYKSQHFRLGDKVNSTFQFAGDETRKLYNQIAEASLAAHASKRKLPEHAEALCSEFIVCAFNDILPSEATESIFGVEPPIYLDPEDSGADITEQCVGLLTFRAWKMLLRRPEGRRIILDVAGCPDADETSYALIRRTVQEWILSDALHQNFCRCLQRMEVSAQPAEYALSEKERQLVLASKNTWSSFA